MTQPTLTPAAFGAKWCGKHRDLKAAYVQLLNYRDDLGNPPLLIVGDLERIEIRTCRIPLPGVDLARR